MYELDYVKKRIRRRIVALVGGIGTTGVTALGIIAFLGRYTGTFTVSVNNGEISLSLSTAKAFEDPQSLLRVDEAYPYEEFTYAAFPEDATLDNEETEMYATGQLDDEGNMESVNYFKYTYYVKNVGTTVANYVMSINVTENVLSEDGRSLLDTLRVMVYSNDAETEDHEKEIFARKAAYLHQYYDDDGVLHDTYQEFVNYYPYGKPIPYESEHALTTSFVSDDTVAKFQMRGFGIQAIQRYSVVLWLEGEDPQSYQVQDDTKTKYTAPIGASIKLGVEINAYEN